MKRKARRASFWQERAERLGDAEKDLVFAAARLNEDRVVSAYLNAAVALVRIGFAMTEKERETVSQAVQQLVAQTHAGVGLETRVST